MLWKTTLVFKSPWNNHFEVSKGGNMKQKSLTFKQTSGLILQENLKHKPLHVSRSIKLTIWARKCLWSCKSLITQLPIDWPIFGRSEILQATLGIPIMILSANYCCELISKNIIAYVLESWDISISKKLQAQPLEVKINFRVYVIANKNDSLHTRKMEKSGISEANISSTNLLTKNTL